jgi:hypothetical protein
MKKSEKITLMLVAGSVLAACGQKEVEPHSRLHLRADSLAPYTTVHAHHVSGVYVYPYYMFSPYGFYGSRHYGGGGYVRHGYYNSRTYQTSVAHNTPHVAHGGFGARGRGGFSVSS